MLEARKVLLLVLAVSFFITILLPISVSAAYQVGQAEGFLKTVAGKAGAEEADAGMVIAKVVKAALTAVGVVFLGLMVYGGMIWMTAHGNEEQVTKARNTIIAASIGLFVIVGSYAITNFVATRIIQGQVSGPAGAGALLGEGLQGCCVDWVASSQIAVDTGGTPACRITTEADCEFQGETATVSDQLACPGPEDGCWMFYEGVSKMSVCNKYCP